MMSEPTTLSIDEPYWPAIEVDPIVTGIQLAASSDQWKDILPPYDQLPDDYKSLESTKESFKFLETMFFLGGRLTSVVPKSGVSEAQSHKVYQAVIAVLSAFGPSHIHKIGGLAFILDSFFTSMEWQANEPEELDDDS